MALTVPNRKKFIQSLVSYIQEYSLHGLDLDKFQVRFKEVSI